MPATRLRRATASVCASASSREPPRRPGARREYMTRATRACRWSGSVAMAFWNFFLVWVAK